jgi:hypothetical protein
MPTLLRIVCRTSKQHSPTHFTCDKFSGENRNITIDTELQQSSYNGPKLRLNSIALLQEQTCSVYRLIPCKPEPGLAISNRGPYITRNATSCATNTKRSNQLYATHHDCHGNSADILSVR